MTSQPPGSAKGPMTDEPRKLMPHQQTALEWARDRDEIALFMEMRLGKTLVAIKWAESRGAKKILVACPLSVVASWERELRLEGIELVKLVGSWQDRERALVAGAGSRWFACNYEGLIERGHRTPSGKNRAVPTEIAELPWDAVIVDESTRIRSPKAQVTKVFMDVLSAAKYKALLTGLPNPEGLDDFVTQFIFMRGEFCGCKSYWAWRDAWCRPFGYEWQPTAKAYAQAKTELAAHAHVLSRKDAGLGNLKVRERRTVELPVKVMKAISKAAEEFEVGSKMTMNVLETITWQTQLTGGRYPHDVGLHHDEKIKELVKLLTSELASDSVVVWAKHTAEIEAINSALKKAKIPTMMVHGKLSGNDATIAKFQTAKHRAVMIAQPKCVQMGIDLSVADTAVYYSNWPDYEIRAQSEDRIEHPKKKRPLLIVDVVARETIDEDFVEMLGDKKQESAIMLKSFMDRAKMRIAS